MKHERHSKTQTGDPVPAQDGGPASLDFDSLRQENKALREAIECNPMPYCVYDSDQRLITSNSAYRRLHPALAKMRSEVGSNHPIYYKDVVRKQLEGTIPDEELEAQIEARMIEQEYADGTVVSRQYGDQHFRVLKFKLPSGGAAGLAFDVTEVRAREADLAEQYKRVEAANHDAETALVAERNAKQNSLHLSELGEWLQSCQSLQELFRVVERFMAKMFPCSSGQLYIYSNSRDVLDGACHWNGDVAPHSHIDPSDCWALRRGRVLHFGSGFAELLCDHLVHSTRGDIDAARYVCIPITAHGDTVGLLHLLQDRPGFDNSTIDLGLAVQCSEQISLAIANVKLRDELHEQSNRDALTGLFNRRYFMNSCRSHFVAAEREKYEFSIISLDADHFKHLNDVHGHEAGDIALASLAKCIKDVAESVGIPARLGGEEFSILLPKMTLKAATKLAEVLRCKVAELEILYAGVVLPKITISCGIASSNSCGTTPREILRAADVALYRAKEQGRNRVVAHCDKTCPST